MRAVKLGGGRPDGVERGEDGPVPGGVHVGGHDAVPRLGQRRVLVADEAVERGARRLEHRQVRDAAVERDAFAAGHPRHHVALLLALLDKRVRMGLAVDLHADPARRHDAHVGDVDVAVLLDKVRADGGGEELRRGDGVLLGEDEDCVLHRVGGDDDRVVAARVRGLDGALEEHADDGLGDGVHARLGVPVVLEDADIVLAVAGSCDRGHDDGNFIIFSIKVKR